MHILQAVEELKRFIPQDDDGFFHISIMDEKPTHAQAELAFQPADDDHIPPPGFVAWCELIDNHTTGVITHKPLLEVMSAKTDQLFFMNHSDFVGFVEAHLSGEIKPLTLQ